MKHYKSTDELLLDYPTTEELKSLLKDNNIKFHPALKEEKKLAEVFIREQKTPKEEKAKEDSSYLEELAQTIKLEEEKVMQKVDRPKVTMFISSNYNYWLKPVGITKEGKRIRYVKGSNTLDIAQQKRDMDVIRLEDIRFIGVSNGQKTFNVNGFIGRSVIRVEDPTLTDYLYQNERFGSDYILYDQAEIAARELAKDKAMTEARYGLYKANRTELVRVLSYLDMLETGRDTFDKHNREDSIDSLRLKAVSHVDNNLDMFIEVMESKKSKVIHLINLAKEAGIIEVSTDKRTVKWRDSGELITRSSASNRWQDDVLKYLLEQPQGKPALEALQTRLNYWV